MKNVVLFVHEDRLNEQISKIQRGAEFLQRIYDKLSAMGAEEIKIEDVQALMIADGSPDLIKKAILKGKILQTASGLTIAKEAIHFDKRAIADFSRICRQAPNELEKSDAYEVVEGKVQVRDSVEDELRARHTLSGTSKQKEIADKLTALAEQIESLRHEMGATHAHHPMRNPDTWFAVDSHGKYVANVYRISQHVNQ